LRDFLWEFQEFLELHDEGIEQKIAVEANLDVQGKLFEHVFVFIGAHGEILVISPPIIKVLLNFEFEVHGNRLALVETLDEAEPLGELISLIHVFIERPDGFEDLCELAHDVGEHTDSYEEERGA